jgi:hypothetical protein
VKLDGPAPVFRQCKLSGFQDNLVRRQTKEEENGVPINKAEIA